MGHARPGFSCPQGLFSARRGSATQSAVRPCRPDYLISFVIYCTLIESCQLKTPGQVGRGRMSGLQRAEWDSGVDSPPQERLGSPLSWDERTPRPDDRDLDRCCALRKAALRYLQGRRPEALLSDRSRGQNGLKERSLTRRGGVGTGPSQSPGLLGPRRPRSLRGSSRTAPESPLPGGVPEHRLRPLPPCGPGGTRPSAACLEKTI